MDKKQDAKQEARLEVHPNFFRWDEECRAQYMLGYLGSMIQRDAPASEMKQALVAHGYSRVVL